MPRKATTEEVVKELDVNPETVEKVDKLQPKIEKVREASLDLALKIIKEHQSPNNNDVEILHTALDMFFAAVSSK